MAMKKPTIGTNWGGNLAFMNSLNSFLVDVVGMEDANNPNHKWATPSVESLRRIMRSLVNNVEYVAALRRLLISFLVLRLLLHKLETTWWRNFRTNQSLTSLLKSFAPSRLNFLKYEEEKAQRYKFKKFKFLSMISANQLEIMGRLPIWWPQSTNSVKSHTFWCSHPKPRASFHR